MESTYVKEANSEVLVILGRNYNTKLEAVQAAARELQREVLRLEHQPKSYDRNTSI